MAVIAYRGVEYEEALHVIARQRYVREERRIFMGGIRAKAVFGKGVYLVSTEIRSIENFLQTDDLCPFLRGFPHETQMLFNCFFLMNLYRLIPMDIIDRLNETDRHFIWHHTNLPTQTLWTRKCLTM